MQVQPKIDSTLNLQLAEWVNRTAESEIRRLLRYSPKYYFAGGKPGVIPLAAFHEIIQNLLTEEKKLYHNDNLGFLTHYNYGPTEGNLQLRSVFSKRLIKRDGLKNLDESQVTLTNGSQQALYALCDILISPGDLILATRPSYLGFLQCAEKVGGKIITVPSDHQGMITDHIPKIINVCKKKFGKTPKVLYSVPYSDNPKGTTLPDVRKRAIYEYSHDYGFMIIEDMAYKEIQFESTKLSPIKKLDVTGDRVAYLSTTTKEAACFRIGYSVIPPNIRDEMIKAKGIYDLCSAEWVQAILTQYYKDYIDKVLPQIRQEYKKRRDAMVKAVGNHLIGTCTKPTGGFFVWFEAENIHFNSTSFIDKALKNDISYVPGATFYPTQGYDYTKKGELDRNRPLANTMRLGYSFQTVENILNGIEKLGRILQK
jgi:2-aminoadipate transaminase